MATALSAAAACGPTNTDGETSSQSLECERTSEMPEWAQFRIGPEAAARFDIQNTEWLEMAKTTEPIRRLGSLKAGRVLVEYPDHTLGTLRYPRSVAVDGRIQSFVTRLLHDEGAFEFDALLGLGVVPAAGIVDHGPPASVVLYVPGYEDESFFDLDSDDPWLAARDAAIHSESGIAMSVFDGLVNVRDRYLDVRMRLKNFVVMEDGRMVAVDNDLMAFEGLSDAVFYTFNVGARIPQRVWRALELLHGPSQLSDAVLLPIVRKMCVPIGPTLELPVNIDDYAIPALSQIRARAEFMLSGGYVFLPPLPGSLAGRVGQLAP